MAIEHHSGTILLMVQLLIPQDFPTVGPDRVDQLVCILQSKRLMVQFTVRAQAWVMASPEATD